MLDEWMVRVEGKEFGPVDLETLNEWREEGRLIPTNELRREGDNHWVLAREVPQLFAAAPAVGSTAGSRSLFGMIAETVRIYAKAFPQFFCLALFVAVPSCVMQVSLAFVNVPENTALTSQAKIASAVAFVAMVVLFVMWPIFLGGLQFGAAEISAGRPFRLRETLEHAIRFWPRLARLSVIVYASYLFWTLIPVLAILALLTGGANVLFLLLALLILAFQVYMAGRLFVNFMFWQQTSTIGGLDGVEALRESKDLARSGHALPRMKRPIYLGAILASLWLLLLLGFSSAAEIPFLVARLQNVQTFDDMFALLQTLRTMPAPDALMIGSYALSSLVHAFLRPLLGISFVVLYLETLKQRE